ncbi:hypothetical protein PLICRDRAFT_428978 [Plicaturopsis crispa FD-325 SS-3]|nr:hypothetical protein PLICRDRAFT_428978 [Plicaturopsis crispa FD-325 SS-3]
MCTPESQVAKRRPALIPSLAWMSKTASSHKVSLSSSADTRANANNRAAAVDGWVGLGTPDSPLRLDSPSPSPSPSTSDFALSEARSRSVSTAATTPPPDTPVAASSGQSPGKFTYPLGVSGPEMGKSWLSTTGPHAASLSSTPGHVGLRSSYSEGDTTPLEHATSLKTPLPPFPRPNLIFKRRRALQQLNRPEGKVNRKDRNKENTKKLVSKTLPNVFSQHRSARGVAC